MSALLHPRPAALLQSASMASVVNRSTSPETLARPSPALASLRTPLLWSGILTAIAVAAVQLSLLGPVPGFAAQWLENWLIAWAVAFPHAYVFGPAIARLFRFLSSPAQRNETGGLAWLDIAAVSARATDRQGFTVLRNLKVREDFYRA